MYDLEELKARVNIVDVAQELGLEPRRSGSNYFARCPFHADQGRPNLSLDARKGAICFRCGYKADVIKLTADVRFHGDTGEAIRFLADRAGLAQKPHPGSQDPWDTANGYASGARAASQPKPLPKGAPLPPDPPDQVATPNAVWRTVTVTFPAGANPVAVGIDGQGHWRRLKDGRVEVIYNRDELTFALSFAGYDLAPDEIATLSNDEIAWVLSGVFDCDLAPEQVKTASLDQSTPRVKIYEALLSFCDQAGYPTPGGIWLYENKGIEPDTQAAFGIAWLNWEKAAAELPQAFGIDALDALGLMVRDKKTGKPVELRFKKHRLLFPFWLTSGGRRYPVYLQGRDVTATDKRFRFDNPSGPVPCPYNFDAVLKARSTDKPVFICEGATDTLTLAQAGFLSCGIVGTQGFKPEWVKHFDGLDVFLATDPDAPGREAARRIAGVFVAQGRPSPKIIPLPQGQDITDYFTGRISKSPVNG
jgi:hypothetical protein